MKKSLANDIVHCKNNEFKIPCNDHPAGKTDLGWKGVREEVGYREKIYITNVVCLCLLDCMIWVQPVFILVHLPPASFVSKPLLSPPMTIRHSFRREKKTKFLRGVEIRLKMLQFLAYTCVAFLSNFEHLSLIFWKICNKDLIRPHCETCGRPLGVIKNQAAGGGKRTGSGIVKSNSGTIEKDKSGGASISNYHGSDSKTAPGKKRKRLKDKNAGLSIPALVAKPAASATATMSSARKKLENKSRLQMMLKQQSTVAQQKKDTALQNFLKLV